MSEKQVVEQSSASASEPESKKDTDTINREATDEEIEQTKNRILREQADLRQQDAPIIPILSFFKKKNGYDPNAIATQPSVYDHPSTAKFFQPHPKYENLHRFDPTFRWSWGEELPLITKMDWRVTLWACLAFFALDLPRGNLSQANSASFLENLGMNTNDYNLGNTVFQISFLCAELPSQMVSKKLGPDRWIPFIMCSWSLVSGCQFWLSGRTSFLVCRALLGVLQGGFIPDVVLYLTYFFKSTELPFRLAMFWTVRRITDIVAPLLALGVLRMDGINGYEGWRWLFLIEGIITLSISVWSWFAMAASPTQTKAWWRPNGWFNEQEEKILVNRILRDDPSKCDMHNRQAITPKLLLKSLADWELWPIYIFGLLWEIPAGPPDQYLTLTLRNLGFNTNDTNLLSIPPQFLGAIFMLIMTYLSEIWDTRALFGAFTQLWYLPNLIAMAVLPADASPWAQYAVVTVLLSYPSPHAMHVSWASRNSHSVRTRAVSAALYNMMVQLARVIYSNIYREDDRPEYRRGNRVLIGICCMNICVYLIAKAFYMWCNKKREKEWNAMTEEERIHYLETTKDEGSNRKDIRFKH
ncbi:major facilitator superfamily transporter [Colletotrichum scovillei]|uniref:Major facilitator superfamily transporter n=1 Tax=Colletotrichum scovillei TaxID=1209932 RepID=A0A9P7R9K5_9PEZI|nr:major facilitator superfamily transporter [Colletotrichum scovillei]KAF4776708.1 major facilitator superfamily transporter [Colletotrichum scovillei]KAG7053417.1 major facilitator superfamily transporter [Colletotrichum scovillei]KAG7071677.1 major facilitator superfamily transporter [Colletotrichum scovillei]KAG7080016.1 major facilitator superfamily transporter [Colletotrichum scovillei]